MRLDRNELVVLGRRLRVRAEQGRLRGAIDVRIDQRLPEQVEIAAYYVVAEALTNAAKHAHASTVTVTVTVTVEAESALQVRVDDDGRGGAGFAGGSGLLGLKDRVEALGGRLVVQSAPGGGTTVHAHLPLPAVSR